METGRPGPWGARGQGSDHSLQDMLVEHAAMMGLTLVFLAAPVFLCGLRKLVYDQNIVAYPEASRVHFGVFDEHAMRPACEK